MIYREVFELHYISMLDRLCRVMNQKDKPRPRLWRTSSWLWICRIRHMQLCKQSKLVSLIFEAKSKELIKKCICARPFICGNNDEVSILEIMRQQYDDIFYNLPYKEREAKETAMTWWNQNITGANLPFHVIQVIAVSLVHAFTSQHCCIKEIWSKYKHAMSNPFTLPCLDHECMIHLPSIYTWLSF